MTSERSAELLGELERDAWKHDGAGLYCIHCCKAIGHDPRCLIPRLRAHIEELEGRVVVGKWFKLGDQQNVTIKGDSDNPAHVTILLNGELFIEMEFGMALPLEPPQVPETHRLAYQNLSMPGMDSSIPIGWIRRTE